VNDTIKVIGDRDDSEITAKTSPKLVWKHPERSAESPLRQVDLDYFWLRSAALAERLKVIERERMELAKDMLEGTITVDENFDRKLEITKEREEILKQLEYIQGQVERLRE